MGTAPSAAPRAAGLFRGLRRTWGTTLLLAAVLPGAPWVPHSVHAAAPEPFLFSTTWVSAVDDATALFVNPAGLVPGRGFETYFEAGFERGGHSQGVGILTLPLLRFGYIHDDVNDSDFDTYAFGTGIDLSPFSFGWTTRLHRGDMGDGASATAHDAGMLLRPVRHLSLGFVLRNLNDPAFAGDRLPRGYAGALSLRPLPQDPERLTATLQGDWRRADDRGRFTIAGEYRLADGVRVGAHVTSRVREAGLSLSVDFPGTSLIARGVEQEGGDVSPRTSYAFHTHLDYYRRNALSVVRRFAEVRIAGSYADQASGFVLAGSETRSAHRLIQVLNRARYDDDVAGVVVTIGPLGGGFIGGVAAIHQEIREALMEIRRSGKPVIAFIEEGGGAAEIYVASAADRIIMPRLATLQGIGVAVEILRLRQTMEKHGIAWDARTAGDYKSTFHTAWTDSATAAQKEEIESLVEAAYAELERTLVEARELSPEAATRILSGGLLTAGTALDLGLIDEIGWYEEARRAASGLAGGGTDPVRLKNLDNRRYWSERWTPPPSVAVVLASGGIESGESSVNRLFGGRTMGSRTVARALTAAASDPNVKAIVLRVDSGGGSSLASDRIHAAIMEILRRRHIPIVVSMGNMAASGGYWISMDADRIVANPLTVTGSIGVVHAKPVIAALLDRQDVRREVFRRGENTDMFSVTRPMTDDEKRQVDREIDETYRLFIDGVARGRNVTVERAEELAGGRVWLGSQARANGLVDSLGTLADAVQWAADAAGIGGDHRTLYFTGQKFNLLTRLVQGVEYVGVGRFGSGTKDGNTIAP